MYYKCQFCEYKTTERSRIHKHHIIPRQSGGTNNKFNLVWLCPNHHSQIYSEYSKNGIHTNQKDSIKIIGWFFSTSGYVLGYIDQDGNERFTNIKIDKK